MTEGKKIGDINLKHHKATIWAWMRFTITT